MTDAVVGPICHPHGVRGYGNPEHGVVVVGIAPGKDEAERSKRPFTGPSGRLLDACLKGAGWSRDSVYTTNTICWPNNAPNEVEIEECGLRFRHEISGLKPRLIVTAGVIANATVMGTKGRRKGSRGAVTWSDRWKCYVLDTHHPSYALQAQSMDAVQDILRDFTKIKRAIGFGPKGSDSDPAKVVWRTVESLAEGQAVLDALPRDGRVVACDIETSSPDVEIIDAYTDQLVCFCVVYDNDAGVEQNVVFPTRIFPQCVRDGTHLRSTLRTGSCVANCDLVSPYALIFPIEHVRWTWQVGQYDIPGLNVIFGQKLPLSDDTMLMSVCADERPGHHGLKPNAREWLAAGWYEEPTDPYKKKGKLNEAPPPLVEEYNARDGSYTKRLVGVHTGRMQADGTQRVYTDVLLPAMQTFIEMQIRGINIDQTKLQSIAYNADGWFQRYLKMYRDLQLEAQEIGWPTDDINLNSVHPELNKLFYQIIGVAVTKLTPKGKPSLDKETLDKMDHPFAARIREFRALDGMLDYVLAVMKHTKYDGLLHPSAFVSTTRTGRTSYRDPAMQTLPKDYTVGADYARLREIIIPHNPETHGIMEADYEQVEVWLAWAFSKDPILHQHLLSGDVHSATAEIAFKTLRTQHSPEEWARKRQNAKKIRFGVQYGEGADKLASPPPIGIGCTVAEARVFLNEYKRGYPVYNGWMTAIQRQAMQQGYLRAPDGGVMRFPVIMDHKQLRQAINFPIQRTASMYNLLSMIDLYHPTRPLGQRLRDLNGHVLLNIHDALVLEYDRRYLHETAALLRDAMQSVKFDGFPSVHVDIKVGPSLGQLTKYKPN